MKQKSSKNMLDLAFEAFKNKKLCDSLIALEFPLNTAELVGYLNSPAKDTLNNYSAYTTCARHGAQRRTGAHYNELDKGIQTRNSPG